MTLLILLDLLLALGMALRLTRLVTGDSLGQWWLREPAQRWALTGKTPESRKRRIDYVEGLGCPYCVGFWVGCGVLVTLWAAGGPGADTWEPWRWVAGALTLNYIAAHLGARLGDTD